MKKLMEEFKEFIMRGNVLDLAVGVIIGGAFQGIVSSLCDDLITPLIQFVISKAIGVNSIEEMTKVLNVQTFKFGSFISAVINFLIMAAIIFAVVKAVNKVMSLSGKNKEIEPTTKQCPFCMSEIDIKATRCPHCTSIIEIVADKCSEENDDTVKTEVKQEIKSE